MATFDKTRFRQAYQMAMAQQAPKMYRELMAAGTLKEQVQETADEAQLIYEETIQFLKKKRGMGNEAMSIASEIVFAEMIQFPQEQDAVSGDLSWLS